MENSTLAGWYRRTTEQDTRRCGLCGPLVDSARLAFDHPGVDPAGDRGENLGRPFLSESADATDIRSFELLGQLGKHRTPVNSAPASAGSAAPGFGASGHQGQPSLFFSEATKLGFFSTNLFAQANQQLTRLFLYLAKSRGNSNVLTPWHPSLLLQRFRRY